MLGIVLAALAAGFLGSPHCVGMCGGFAAACARPGAGRAGAGGGARLRVLGAPGGAALWHLGRLTTYALLGALGGAVGGALPGPAWVPALVSVPLLVWFSASLGGLVPGGGARIPGLARAGAALARREGAGWRYLFGAATGLLPCGLLYAALALALSAGSAAVGALAMVAFGLGTVPALALLSVTVRRLALTGVRARRALALLVLLAGLGSVGMRLVMRPGAHGHRPLPGIHMRAP
jgi:sulfite exporter TauE/SafE